MLNTEKLRKSIRQLSTEFIKEKKHARIHTFTIKYRVYKRSKRSMHVYILLQLSTEFIKEKKHARIHTFTIEYRVYKRNEACTYTYFYN